MSCAPIFEATKESLEWLLATSVVFETAVYLRVLRCKELSATRTLFHQLLKLVKDNIKELYKFHSPTTTQLKAMDLNNQIDSKGVPPIQGINYTSLFFIQNASTIITV